MEEGIKKRKKTIKRVIAIVVILVLFGGILGMVFSNKKASQFTEAEHLERVRNRIQKRFIEGDVLLRSYGAPDDGRVHPGIKATGFEVYPLYDENDQLKYCLVEFEPCGYVYIRIRDERLKWLGWPGVSVNMYKLSAERGEQSWAILQATEKASGEIEWAPNPNEEGVKYHNSPFAVRNVMDQRKYFICYKLDINGGTKTITIPSIKQNGKYVNLYSMESFDLEEAKKADMQMCSIAVHFYIDKKFDLK